MARATLTSKGQITIPKEIREQLHLAPGVRFEFYVDAEGRIVMVPLTAKLEDMIGILPYQGKTLTVEEIDRAIVEGAVARATRGL